MSVVLNEEFESSQGQWENYDAYDPALRAAVRDQSHVDIRNMRSADITALRNVLELSSYELDDLQGLTVAQVAALTTALKKGENWGLARPMANEVPDPSFENTGTFSNRWIAYQNGGALGTATRFTDPNLPRTGGAVCRLNCTTGGLDLGVVTSTTTPMSVTPGERVSAFGHTWASGARRNAKAIIAWRDTGNSHLASVTGAVAMNSDAGWTRTPTVSAIAPANAAFFNVYIVIENPIAGEVHYVDDVMAIRGPDHASVVAYFDGTYPGYVWTGTAHQTRSVAVTPTAPLSSHNYWNFLTVPIIPNNEEGVVSMTDPINLVDGFEFDDYISLALPNFPLEAVSLANSYVDITSSPTGDFLMGPTGSVPLSASLVPLVAGNSEFRALRSSFTIDLTAVTGVRLRFANRTGSIPFENRIANPSLEGNFTTGFAGFGAGISSPLGSGGYGLRVLRAVASGSAVFGPYYPGGLGVVPGSTWQASVKLTATSLGGRACRVAIEWYNGGALLSTSVGNVVTAGGRSTVQAVAPGSANKAFVTFYSTTAGTAGEWFESDGWLMTEVPANFSGTIGYFDGDSPGFSYINPGSTGLRSGNPIVRVGALRLLSKDWKYSNLDMDTRFGTLVRPMSRNGDPAALHEFTQPIVWRADDVPGELDPKPVDFNLAVGFNTGARQGSNQISIYGRELTEDYMQQLDLNGLPQGRLTGREQPDIGEAAYNERVQTDLEPFKQDQLEGLKQFDLERTPDYLSASWIEFVLNWTSTNTQLSVTNTEGDGYNFNLGTPLAVNTSYVLVFELEDTSARAAIYPLGDRGEIRFNAPVFDSTRMDDDFSYKRRKGRFGWYASLADGDAFVESIRFRSASYAEYRSLPYESLTPVIGAELTAESSPVIDLFEYFVPTASSITVAPDNELSNSGKSWVVTDYGPYGFQGVQSNLFPITDFDQTEVLLDVYYPSSIELDATVEFYLKSQYNYLIPLPKPKVYPDQWQTVRLRTPSAHLAQTGDYRLVVIQNRPANLNWWIDNVRVFERTVSWHGRAYVDDPWAETEDDWTPFQNAFNRAYGGILFQGRERKLQVKGIGHKQDATITKVQFKPKYAELGRFVWPEQALIGRIAPVASYSTSNSGRLYTFNGFGSSDADGMVINWQWSISDGTVYTGPVIQHLFGASGTYAVTLMVTDHNGLVHTTSANHSVA